jgi:hypothetical protein
MASARQILHQASTPEELIGKLLEAADMLEDNHEASPQHATAYFAMASGLREAARALSLLLNKPCEPPAPESGRVRPPSAVPAGRIDSRADSTAR